jgi:hypothetical protein
VQRRRRLAAAPDAFTRLASVDMVAPRSEQGKDKPSMQLQPKRWSLLAAAVLQLSERDRAGVRIVSKQLAAHFALL